MHIPPEPFFYESGIHGPAPVFWYGWDRPDGDASPFQEAPVGATYYRKDHTSGICQIYIKSKNDGTDDDWRVQGVGCISQTVTYDEFTDGGSTAGTLDLNETIPAGAWYLQSVLKNVTGFTGDSSCTIQIGDGTDPDRYSTGTPSVFTTAVGIDPGVPSGTKIHVAEKTPRITLTSGTDWGDVDAGQMTVMLFYLA